MRSKWTGLGLIIIGVGLLMVKTDWPYTDRLWHWEFGLLAAGLILLLAAITRRNRSMTLWAAMLTGVGLQLWAPLYIPAWPKHWSMILWNVGAAFLVRALVFKERQNGIIGALLIAVGLFAWPKIKEVEGLAGISDTLHTYWPALIVLLGFVLIVMRK
ncbi:hypothetical protein [Polycladomyces abyssicola]|nr:hypothetical protein [Polycladomyces abyssicola]